MKITRIDHVAAAVNNLDEELKILDNIFGLKPVRIENVPSQKVRIGMIPVGETNIEIVESADPSSAIAKYIGTKGEGLQHMAFHVDDIRGALAELKAKGIPLIDQEPRPGNHGSQVAFIHPKATKILIELVQD